MIPDLTEYPAINEMMKLLRLDPDAVEDMVQHVFGPKKAITPGLTRSEDTILQTLLHRPNVPIRREQLLSIIYSGSPDTPEIKIIDVFVCKLRKKIAEGFASLPEGRDGEIVTIHGRGYAFYTGDTLKTHKANADRLAEAKLAAANRRSQGRARREGLA